jgi:hypothetical protein
VVEASARALSASILALTGGLGDLGGDFADVVVEAPDNTLAMGLPLLGDLSFLTDLDAEDSVAPVARLLLLLLGPDLVDEEEAEEDALEDLLEEETEAEEELFVGVEDLASEVGLDLEADEAVDWP